MKVDVITRHAITNYGSLLQAYATQKVIEELGYECEIVDYIRSDEAYQNHEKTLLRRKNNWNSNVLKRALYLLVRQPESIIAGKKFERERKKYLNLSRRYSSKEEIAENPPVADVYATGSDQVWGPTEDGTYDSNYCLSFVGDAKKIAYAASFGHTEMTDELCDYFSKFLKSYSYITLREDSAVKIVESLGLSAKQVLDPTLLFEKKFWENIVQRPKIDDYVLVYQLHNNNRLNKYAEKVAKKKKLKLIRVSASLHQITRPGKMIFCPNIAEFLGYVKCAKLLITDSFHGTAFAINFNTPFVEVLPNNNTGTRNISILTLTGLSDRILKEEGIAIEDTPIDFTYANQILDSERMKSKKLLKEMIIG